MNSDSDLVDEYDFSKGSRMSLQVNYELRKAARESGKAIEKEIAPHAA